MRYVGRIADWNDKKGFGFVAPNGGGDRAFVHVTAFERVPGRPSTGQLISYDLARDEKGRFKAAAIRYVPLRPKDESSSRAMRPGIGVAFLVLLSLGWLSSKVPSAVLLVYIGASVLSIFLYAADKSAARNNRWRTPENTLHIVALLGGWPGALVSHDVFRHKSRKEAFQFVFWGTVVLNCGALLWLLASGTAVVINRAIFAP